MTNFGLSLPIIQRKPEISILDKLEKVAPSPQQGLMKEPKFGQKWQILASIYIIQRKPEISVFSTN